MDPVTGAVVAAVIFFVLAAPVAWLSVIVFTGLAALISEGVAFIGAIVGWLVGIGLSLFFIIQGVLQVVRVFQLIL